MKLAGLPFLPLTAGIIAGIIAQRFIQGTALPVAMVAAAVVSLLLRGRVVTIALMAGVIGWISGWLHEPTQFSERPPRATVCSGVVTDVVIGEGSRRVEVKVDAMASLPTDSAGKSVKFTQISPEELQFASTQRFSILLTLKQYDPPLAPGDEVVFCGSYSLPGIHTDLPLENDMAQSLRNRGISLTCFVPEKHIVVTGRKNSVPLALKRWREELAGNFLRSEMAADAAVFYTAVITGDASSVGDETRSQFASAGVAHVLALSGAHLAVLAWLLSMLTAPLAFAGRRKLRQALVIGLLWLFVILTGGSASVVRAAIMASVVALAVMLERPRSSLNSLLFAAFAILLFSPAALFTAGFQLSFAAALSIILFAEPLNPVSPRSPRSHKVASYIAVSLAATILTMPLVAWHFHNVPLFFLPVNIVAALLIPFMLGGGVLFALLSLVGIEPQWLVASLDTLYDIFSGTATFFASLPGSSVTGVYPTVTEFVGSYLFIIATAVAFFRRSLVCAVCAVAVLLLTVAERIFFSPTYPEVEAYSIANSDATFLLVKHSDTLEVFTNDAPYNQRADSAFIAQHYSGYINSRNIKQIKFYCKDFRLSTLADRNNILHINATTLKFYPSTLSNGASDTIPTTYCLVAKGYKGDIVELARSCGSDTILLSSDLNSRRRNRYASELTESSVPFINLSETHLFIP